MFKVKNKSTLGWDEADMQLNTRGMKIVIVFFLSRNPFRGH